MTIEPKLRELADAATPGPWRHKQRTLGGELVRDTVLADNAPVAYADGHEADFGANDAAFIAAANPTTVIDLLDQLEAATDAIAYALRRVGTDAEFAYHMLFTETLDRLVRAYARIKGREPDEVRSEIMERTRHLPQARCEADKEFIDGGSQL